MVIALSSNSLSNIRIEPKFDRNSILECGMFALMTADCSYDQENTHLCRHASLDRRKRFERRITSKKRKINETHYGPASDSSFLVPESKDSLGSILDICRALPRRSIAKKIEKLNTTAEDTLDMFNLSVYSEMVQSSKHFYSIDKLRKLPSPNGPILGDTSTLRDNNNKTLQSLDSTNTESKEETPDIIPARFEDKDTSDASKEIEKLKDIALEDAIFFSVVGSLSLDEAFGIQSSARLITGTERPYLILHANAAFLQLSGLSSNKVIGHPINTIINIPMIPSKLSPYRVSKDSIVSLKYMANRKSRKASVASKYQLTISKVYSGTRTTHLSFDMLNGFKMKKYGNFVAMSGVNVSDINKYVNFVAMSG